jgi:hypothetical protein
MKLILELGVVVNKSSLAVNEQRFSNERYTRPTTTAI